jgi:triosephosphate isomerase
VSIQRFSSRAVSAGGGVSETKWRAILPQTVVGGALVGGQILEHRHALLDVGPGRSGDP